MTKSKIISLVVVIIVVVGAIVYLESLKVHPLASGSGSTGGVQAINISPDTGMSVNASSSGGAMSDGSGTSTTTAPPDLDTAPTNINMSSTATTNSALQALAQSDEGAGDKPAVEIVDPTGFVNVSSSFTLGSQIGKKVILLDFWTYSCINCIRTLPYLTAWDAKYRSSGLEIVGIHTPEFDFEKDITNVEAAATQYGIKYPIVLDSNYGTWQAYNNLYWPHEYLIDMAGYIVHDHVGEGDYDTTEAEIQKLLTQRAQILGNDPSTIPTGTVNVTAQNINDIQSPETYFGAERNEYLANGTQLTNGNQTLTLPSSTMGTTVNALYLGGTWTFDDQYATNVTAGAKILYTYNASKVYIVASGAPAGTTVEVLQDGAPVTAADAGSDVVNGKVTITGSRLYNLINDSDGAGQHTLELIVDQPGLQAFTFTFG